MLVTIEVANSMTLEDLIDSKQLYSKGVMYVRALLRQLALALQRLHCDGFFHRDLKTRNILVQDEGDKALLYFFDCPSGHHPLPFFRRSCIVRDLAYLERGLRGHVRKVDLLYFYQQYRGSRKLESEYKKLATDSLNYYAGRRMTAKRRSREKF